jgi:hypothetical protein
MDMHSTYHIAHSTQHTRCCVLRAACCQLPITNNQHPIANIANIPHTAYRGAVFIAVVLGVYYGQCAPLAAGC